MDILKKITWCFNDDEWDNLVKVNDLRLLMMRVFRKANCCSKEEATVIKSTAEIATILMRME